MPKIRVRDIEMHYEETGQGTPLLLIHGLGSSARDWERQIPYFSKNYRVITYDVRGHGQTDKPAGPYGIPLFAQDTAEFMKILNIESAHVVGISMGGMIALQLAVNAPERIRSLVVVNTGAELIVRSFREFLMVLQRKLIVRLLGMQKMGEILSGRLFPDPEHEELRKIFVEHWAENDPRAYRDSMQALLGWSVTDKLGFIPCPTLIVSADNDYTPVEVKEAIVAKMPNAKLVVIPNSHHAVPVERPEEFNRIVGEFLAENS